MPVAALALVMTLTTQVGDPHSTTSPESRVIPPPAMHVAMPDISYGWQTLIASLSGIALFAVGLAVQEEVVAGIGAAAYLIASPAIHLGHGQGFNSLMSFALNLLSPALAGMGGGLVGTAVCETRSCNGWGTIFFSAGIGAGLGALIAVGIDSFLIANKPPPDSPMVNVAVFYDGQAIQTGLRLSF